MNSENRASDDGQLFPWTDVAFARNNSRLQRKHPISEGRAAYGSIAKPCPQCHTVAEHLAWFYFETPQWTWDQLCGRAGWMTVCDKCRLQVDFFVEVLNG